MKLTPKMKYKANFNGYRPSHRNKWLLLAEGALTQQEVMLLEFYADQLVFDPKKDTYGTFEFKASVVQKIFRVSSPNTIRNWHKGLIKKGFIFLVIKPNTYTLTSFRRYISPGKWQGEANKYAKGEMNQPVELILQHIGVQTQLDEQVTQSVAVEERLSLKDQPSKALSSSKVESKVYSYKSYEEYKQIFKDNGNTGLTPEDMSWLEENITESKNMPP